MFSYTVLIVGLEHIPLRTTRQGAKDILTSFLKRKKINPETVMRKITAGIPFKDTCVTVSKIKTTKKTKK